MAGAPTTPRKRSPGIRPLSPDSRYDSFNQIQGNLSWEIASPMAIMLFTSSAVIRGHNRLVQGECVKVY
jgi:hypothetical protein